MGWRARVVARWPGRIGAWGFGWDLGAGWFGRDLGAGWPGCFAVGGWLAGLRAVWPRVRIGAWGFGWDLGAGWFGRDLGAGLPGCLAVAGWRAGLRAVWPRRRGEFRRAGRWRGARSSGGGARGWGCGLDWAGFHRAWGLSGLRSGAGSGLRERVDSAGFHGAWGLAGLRSGAGSGLRGRMDLVGFHGAWGLAGLRSWQDSWRARLWRVGMELDMGALAFAVCSNTTPACAPVSWCSDREALHFGHEVTVRPNNR